MELVPEEVAERMQQLSRDKEEAERRLLEQRKVLFAEHSLIARNSRRSFVSLKSIANFSLLPRVRARPSMSPWPAPPWPLLAPPPPTLHWSPCPRPMASHPRAAWPRTRPQPRPPPPSEPRSPWWTRRGATASACWPSTCCESGAYTA
jgi:hypothetical protein